MATLTVWKFDDPAAALSGSLTDFGIDDDFVNEARERVGRPGRTVQD